MSDNLFESEHKLVIGKKYDYCPWCSAKLIEVQLDGKSRRRCPECDFIYYRNPIPAAGAIIVKNGKILLVKRKYPPYVGDWCFPAGFMEYGEAPGNCCVREVAEETGLEIELTSSFKVYSGNDDPRSRAVLIIYLAKVTGGRLKPGDDADEVRYFSREEIPANIAFESHTRAIDDYYEFEKSRKLPEPNG